MLQNTSVRRQYLETIARLIAAIETVPRDPRFPFTPDVEHLSAKLTTHAAALRLPVPIVVKNLDRGASFDRNQWTFVRYAPPRGREMQHELAIHSYEDGAWHSTANRQPLNDEEVADLIRSLELWRHEVQDLPTPVPPPATETYAAIVTHPEVAAARADVLESLATVRFELVADADDEKTKEQFTFADKYLSASLRDAAAKSTRAMIDYGRALNEIVWDVVDGHTVPIGCQLIGPDGVVLYKNPHGQFSGYQVGEVYKDKRYAFHAAFDAAADPIFGRGLPENCRQLWARLLDGETIPAGAFRIAYMGPGGMRTVTRLYIEGIEAAARAMILAAIVNAYGPDTGKSVRLRSIATLGTPIARPHDADRFYDARWYGKNTSVTSDDLRRAVAAGKSIRRQDDRGNPIDKKPVVKKGVKNPTPLYSFNDVSECFPSKMEPRVKRKAPPATPAKA